jgi:FMN reductase
MESASRRAPFIVGIGGTTKPNSSTEQALLIALDAASRRGANTRLFGGEMLVRLPHYLTEIAGASSEGRELVADIRRADGIIFASPGYHGSLSGLVKNAIDYIEETAHDRRVYLDGIPVGLIATAYGWQAAGNALAALRAIAHALRGWPTPLGAAINCSGGIFKNGTCSDAGAATQLQCIGQQVCDFARLRLNEGGDFSNVG